MALDRLIDLVAHRFYVLVAFSLFKLFLCATDKVCQLSDQLLGAQ